MLYHLSILQKSKLRKQNTKRIVELLPPSYKNFPSNLEVIDWLGSYFIEMQVPSILITMMMMIIVVVVIVTIIMFMLNGILLHRDAGPGAVLLIDLI